MNFNGKKKCLQKYGKNPLSYLSLINHLDSLIGDFDGFITYKKKFNTIIALGDPIVPEKNFQRAIEKLKSISYKNKNSICIFSCSDRISSILDEKEFKGISIGKTAVVNLSKFTIKGGKNWSIRSSINYAKKHNYVIEEYNPSYYFSEELEDNIKKISEQWLRIKNIPEPRFVIGKLNFNDEFDQRFFICRNKGEIVGYINYYPVSDKEYYLDHTRRITNAPRGVMDFLMVKSFEKLKSEGFEKVYIGLSPFKMEECKNAHFSLVEKIFFQIGKYLISLFYPIKSEYFFKKKYATNWEMNYCYFFPRLSFKSFLSLSNIFYSGGIKSLLYKKLKGIIKR